MYAQPFTEYDRPQKRYRVIDIREQRCIATYKDMASALACALSDPDRYVVR